MKNIIYVILCSFLITACNNTEENNSSENESEKTTSNIELSSEQFKTVGIKLGKIEQKNLHDVVKASGYLAVPPQNKANVSTFIGAIVKNIFVLEGNFVKKGQLLASLEHPDFIKLQEEYLTAKDNYIYAEQEYLRQKELAEQNAGTGKIFQKAKSDYNIAKAKVSSLESQLRLLSVNIDQLATGKITSQINLKAPIDGFVGKININIGSFAEPNNILFEITDNTQIHCDLFIYEKDIFKVKVGQKVNFVLTNLPEHQEEHNNKTIEGDIFGINKSFENDTKSLTVHAKIENENHELIPGMYVNALIDVGEQTTSAVPVEAVVKSAGKDWIFTLVKKNIDGYEFKMVEVITGVTDLGFIEIKPLEKIADNTKIVIKNPFFILSKAKEGENGEED